MNSGPLSSCSDVTGNGNRRSRRSRASTVECMPRFHVGVISVHWVLRSVCVSVQKKFSRMSPPQCATVSICVSPGGTRQAMTSSPERHSIASRSGLFSPDLRLRFAEKGFFLGRPRNARSRVEALILSSDSLAEAGLRSATHSSYSRTMRGSSRTKYVVHGHPTASHSFLAICLASSL